MKRIKGLLVLLLLFPLIINASCINSDGSGKRGSVSLSASSLNVTVGQTTTFKISAPCAAGRISISSSDSSIATVTPDSEFLDDSSLTVTIKGKSAGTVTISVLLEDVADYASNTISGTKKVTVNVKNPVTTTKKPTTKGTTKATTKPTTVTTKPTTKVIKEIKINTFDVVGYDIPFDMNTFEYTIDVDPNVKKLYIITTGENFKADGDKEVNIDGKDSIVVNFSNEDRHLEYKININRVSAASVPTEKIEVVKEVVKTNNTFLYTTVGLGILAVILAVLLVKSKEETTAVSTPAMEKSISPIETTHINSPTTGTVTNTYTNTGSVPVNPTPQAQVPVQNNLENPIDKMYIQPNESTPINPMDNNLQ